eukprot:3722966-Rhodomonas_salina.2
MQRKRAQACQSTASCGIMQIIDIDSRHLLSETVTVIVVVIVTVTVIVVVIVTVTVIVVVIVTVTVIVVVIVTVIITVIVTDTVTVIVTVLLPILFLSTTLLDTKSSIPTFHPEQDLVLGCGVRLRVEQRMQILLRVLQHRLHQRRPALAVPRIRVSLVLQHALSAADVFYFIFIGRSGIWLSMTAMNSSDSTMEGGRIPERLATACTPTGPRAQRRSAARSNRPAQNTHSVVNRSRPSFACLPGHATRRSEDEDACQGEDACRARASYLSSQARVCFALEQGPHDAFAPVRRCDHQRRAS